MDRGCWCQNGIYRARQPVGGGVSSATPPATARAERQRNCAACAGSGSVKVRTESDALVFSYDARVLFATEWKSIEQRVPIDWTACHLAARRPWFTCAICINGQYCGRRVGVLYVAGDLFACRKCYGLAYASQQGGFGFRG
jgi:hypothetical protein